MTWRPRAILVGFLSLVVACEEFEYREKLEIRADRGGRVTIEFEMRRLAGLPDLLGPLADGDLPLISPERLEEPLPEGLELIEFEDRSDDERFEYRFIVGFDDVDALRQIDSLMPATSAGKSSYLFRGLSWEARDEGSWHYRRQLGDGNLPEDAAMRRRFAELDLSFVLELHAPESIQRTNANSSEGPIARWQVSSQDILNEGGRVVLHAEASPGATRSWLAIPIGLVVVGLIWAATRRRRRPA